MKIALIRHGATKGNLEKRYIGITDESLCDEGKDKLEAYIKAGKYPDVKKVYVSPMKRCIQTAQMIYPEKEIIVINGFRECNFGTFEGKNYKELSGDKEYQRWIDSNAQLPFPEGEDNRQFKKRCMESFISVIKQLSCRKEKDAGISCACIVHGGTIMSILSLLYGGDYYDYHCGNAEGYICEVTQDAKITDVKKI